ncbi:MAG: DUF2271 domain-containing protein [Clostridiales bacterium]|jgi:hypothetical protein|nr:DUF2271 domain-containing protein [Clostridiales bacterium]
MEQAKAKALAFLFILILLSGCDRGTDANSSQSFPSETISESSSIPLDDLGQPEETAGDAINDETAQPEGDARGALEISFKYERQSGSGSNQFAVWVEDSEGNYIKTIFATSFTATGGWSYRENSIPIWVEASDLKSRGEAWIDAVSSATPASGDLAFTWDLSDDEGHPVSAGVYYIRLEATLRQEDRVSYTALIALGSDAQETQPQAEYIGDGQGERHMIGNVSVKYTPQR